MGLHATEKPKKSRRSIIRGPRTAWILFCESNRKKVMALEPGLSFGGACKRMAAEWSSMSTDEKSVFVVQQQEDRLRYDQQLQDLPKRDQAFLRKLKRDRKKVRRQRKPKCVLSAYMHFVLNRRVGIVEQNPTADFKTIGKLLGVAWTALSPDEKQTYVSMHLTDKVRYNQELMHLNQESTSKAVACI